MRPTANGRAWRTLFQNASTVCPDRVRPDWSVIVPLTMTGRRRAQLFEERLDREDRGLAVERVEDRLDEQDVGATGDQATRGGRVRVDELLPGHVARAGVVDVGRDGSRLGGRPERAGDEARPVRRRSVCCVGCLPGERRGGPVDLLDVGLQGVLGHRDRGAVEGVGGDDIGACLEVRVVDLANYLRLGEIEDLVRAAQVARMARETLAAKRCLIEAMLLDERAHGTVEHDDPLAHQVVQPRNAFTALSRCTCGLAHRASVGDLGLEGCASSWAISPRGVHADCFEPSVSAAVNGLRRVAADAQKAEARGHLALLQPGGDCVVLPGSQKYSKSRRTSAHRGNPSSTAAGSTCTPCPRVHPRNVSSRSCVCPRNVSSRSCVCGDVWSPCSGVART